MSRIFIALPAVLAGGLMLAAAAEPGWTVNLTGAQEAPGPGDPDGSGSAKITLDEAADAICYDLSVSGIATATAAHIHRAAAGAAGPPVVTLEAPTDGNAKGCAQATAELLAEIKANPAGFYVNVHNAEFKPGAVRGQLAQ